MANKQWANPVRDNQNVMSDIRVQCSDSGQMIEVSNPDELDHLLDEYTLKASPERPIILYVYAHSYQVMIGLGGKVSFIHFEHESGDPPYIVSLGESNIDGALTYYLFDYHHTEIPRRYLISIEKARDIMRKWIITGDRPLDAKWTEV